MITFIHRIITISFTAFLKIYQSLFSKSNVIKRYLTKFDGVEFYLVTNYYEMADLLIGGHILPKSIAEAFMYKCIGAASAYSIKYGDYDIVYVPKGYLETSFGTSIVAHEVFHIMDRHADKKIYGKYEGINFNEQRGVVYDFEARADAYALKMCGELFYSSDKNWEEFKRIERESTIQSVEEFEDMFGKDDELSILKRNFIDDKIYKNISAEKDQQIEIRKKLLSKYL